MVVDWDVLDDGVVADDVVDCVVVEGAAVLDGRDIVVAGGCVVVWPVVVGELSDVLCPEPPPVDDEDELQLPLTANG